MTEVFQINLQHDGEARRRYIEADTLEEAFPKIASALEEEGIEAEQLATEESILIKNLYTRRRYRINSAGTALMSVS